jgi:hypothetical protein
MEQATSHGRALLHRVMTRISLPYGFVKERGKDTFYQNHRRKPLALAMGMNGGNHSSCYLSNDTIY